MCPRVRHTLSATHTLPGFVLTMTEHRQMTMCRDWRVGRKLTGTHACLAGQAQMETKPCVTQSPGSWH